MTKGRRPARLAAQQMAPERQRTKLLDTAPKKGLAFACVVIAALAGVTVLNAVNGGGSSDSEPFRSRMPPVEFLYLDGARILNYLAQLEGGRVGAVHRISKEVTSVNAGAESGGFKVGASSQREEAAESTLVPTETSELALMLNGLRENTRPGVAMHPVQLEAPRDLAPLREGWLVSFRTRDLLGPGYIRPYVVLRQSATLAALFPRAASDPESAERAEEQRRRAESFARQVGPNPRLIFTVAPHRSGTCRPLRVLLPMAYRGLTSERSLLEKDREQFTGGELTVIGKVVRVFPSADGRGCEPIDDREAQLDYTDFATQEIWTSPLQQASKYLIRHVSHSCETTTTEAEREEQPSLPEKVNGRRCFLVKLKRQTRLYAPGAVILPIAVYK